jgi:hypothetical protein
VKHPSNIEDTYGVQKRLYISIKQRSVLEAMESVTTKQVFTLFGKEAAVLLIACC